MKERPILFSAPMVRALLAGTKTQTRRIVKPQFDADADIAEDDPVSSEGFQMSGHSGLWRNLAGDLDDLRRCPYGVPGDTLWVRENFRLPLRCAALKPKDCCPSVVCYEAERENYSRLGWGNLHPAIHLPRWASRITLRVTDVRVERLNEIDDSDSTAEGIVLARKVGWSFDGSAESFTTPALGYRALWEKINGPGAGAANPWVWAVSFEVVK